MPYGKRVEKYSMNNDITYLKKHYPHLHRVQRVIDRAMQFSYKGNVFIDLRFVSGSVDKITTSWSEEDFVVKRENNKL